MQWLRLQLPVFYLASILLAGALPCASHAAAHEAAAPAHQAHLDHAHHAAHEALEPPCHSGEDLCGCEAVAERLQSATANSRDEMALAAIAASGAEAAPVLARLPIIQGSDPPERQSLIVSFYDGIHGRSTRLQI